MVFFEFLRGVGGSGFMVWFLYRVGVVMGFGRGNDEKLKASG